MNEPPCFTFALMMKFIVMYGFLMLCVADNAEPVVVVDAVPEVPDTEWVWPEVAAKYAFVPLSR